MSRLIVRRRPGRIVRPVLRPIRGASLGAQLSLYLFVSLGIIMFSMSILLFTTVRLQQMMNDRFRDERFFQDLQRQMEAVRTPCFTYLSTRSSTALAQLLIEEQIMRGMLPPRPPIGNDPIALTTRELIASIGSYLDLIQKAIDSKRARAIDEYTSIYETMVRLDRYIVSQIEKISLQGLRTQLSSYERIMATSRTLQVWNLLVLISAFLSAIFWMLHSINRLTEPMHQLARMADELSRGNFDVPDIYVRAVSEVSTVVESFNTMKNDISRYIAEIRKQKSIEQGYMAEKLRNMKMEQIIKRMELYTMQAQMNPHFLFNTLNTGVQLAIMEQADRTADFMENLAAFFRHNLRDRNLIVPLRHEVEGLESYFYILKIRFPRSIELSLEVPDELLDTCSVPSLILQPLVENSVIHAFSGITRIGRIEVKVERNGPILTLSVADNGIGIKPELVERLLRRYPRDAEHPSKVMGLENVIQRLYFFYPEREDVITIESGPGEGTRISINIDTRDEPCITL